MNSLTLAFLAYKLKCNESAFFGKVQMQTSVLILSVKNQSVLIMLMI